MTNILFYSTQDYDKNFFIHANRKYNWQLDFLTASLNDQTAKLSEGYSAICIFVYDIVNASIVKQLKELGVKLIALRCAGFNNVDIKAAEKFGIQVVRVPNYSPYSIAELTVGLLSVLNRKIHRAYLRVKEGNFSLTGLIGHDLHGKTVGIIGTGNIGTVVAHILKGYGMRLLGNDLIENPECIQLGLQYTDLETLYKQSDVITLHCPLTPKTRHLINMKAIAQMKNNVLLINTSRGAVVDTKSIITALKNRQIAGFGLDVYEHEDDLFFKDLSGQIINDDLIERLITFPNVILTCHQGFFTIEAMEAIAETTMDNIDLILAGKKVIIVL